MPFDGDDGDARDGASPSGSAGGAVGLPALAASSLSIGSTLRQHREATWASGETTIHGRYTLAHKLRAIENLPTGLCTYIHTYSVHVYTPHPDGRDFEGVDRRDRGRMKRQAKEAPERWTAVHSPRSTGR